MCLRVPATAPANQKRTRLQASETEAAWTPVESLNSEAMAFLESESAVVQDDRNEIQSGDRSVLIVEDDISFAGILLDLAREKGFKGLVATERHACPGAGAEIQTVGDHPRYSFAGSRWLDGS